MVTFFSYTLVTFPHRVSCGSHLRLHLHLLLSNNNNNGDSLKVKMVFRTKCDEKSSRMFYDYEENRKWEKEEQARLISINEECS